MANITPKTLFPNYAFFDGKLEIPLTDIEGLTSALAHPDTGDGREVFRLLIESIVTRIQNLATVAQPIKMKVSRSRLQGESPNEQVTQEYTLSFTVSTPMEANYMPPEI